MHKEFSKKVLDFMEDPGNFGDLHVFSMSCFDTLAIPSFKEGKDYVQ
jgi:hypothetical protein